MVPKGKWALLTGAVMLLAACAGSSLNKIDKATELPKELSQDVKEKFEVRDVTQATPQPSPVASPSPVPSMAPVLVSENAPFSPGPSPHKKKHKKSKHDSSTIPEDEFVGPPLPKLVYPKRRPAKEPIWVGEKLTYQVTYLGIPAGTFTLEALPFKAVGSRKVYHIMAKAWNSAVFGLVYKLDDFVETYIDYDSFFSHRFHLHQDETKQMRDSLELYDSEKRQSYWWNRWDRKERGFSENKDFYPMEPFPQDTLSSLYYLRSVPLPPKAVVSFPVMSEGKPLTAFVTVVRREELDTPVGPLMTVKLKPEAATRGVLEKRGDSFMWVTDDERRFLVRIEAKVKIGTVVVELKKIEKGTPPE